MVLEETEAQAEVRLLRERARVALDMAAEVAEHIVAESRPDDGRTERGIEMIAARTPLHSVKVDDADELFARLVDDALVWAERLHFAPPEPSASWQGIDRETGLRFMRGFRAGMTPSGAARLIRRQAQWLSGRLNLIAEHPSGREFMAEIVALVWGLRGQYKLTPERVRSEAPPRLCERCGELAVRAEFFGGSFQAAELRGDELVAEGIEVRCGHCGEQVAVSLSSIVRWLS